MVEKRTMLACLLACLLAYLVNDSRKFKREEKNEERRRYSKHLDLILRNEIILLADQGGTAPRIDEQFLALFDFVETDLLPAVDARKDMRRGEQLQGVA